MTFYLFLDRKYFSTTENLTYILHQILFFTPFFPNLVSLRVGGCVKMGIPFLPYFLHDIFTGIFVHQMFIFYTNWFFMFFQKMFPNFKFGVKKFFWCSTKLV